MQIGGTDVIQDACKPLDWMVARFLCHWVLRKCLDICTARTIGVACLFHFYVR